MSIRKNGFRRNLTILIVLLFIISGLSMTFGDVRIAFTDTYSIIWESIKKLLGQPFISRGSSDIIIMKIRFPRILAAIVAGAGLSIAGCSYQGVFRNPMADPYILGVSSGATLGAAIAIIITANRGFMGLGFITLASFIGAIGATVTVYSMAMKDKRLSVRSLLLSGISLSYFLGAVVSILLVLNEKQVSKIIYWTMGNLASPGYRELIVMAITVFIFSIAVYRYSGELDILTAGDEIARSSGVESDKVRRNILLYSSLIVAVCVAFTGTIGFVGLIVPHVVRRFSGPSHRTLIPLSMVTGSILLVVADAFARTVIDGAELPVGAVTSAIGAPFFIWLLLKNRR